MIENLPNTIKVLNLGWNFYLELNNLPTSIEKISFDENSKYNIELNNLSKSLKVLKLPLYYEKEIKNISPNCKIIK